MVELLRILLPIDFSEPSREAAKYAFSLADRFGAELHALHVVEAIAPTLPEAARHMASFPKDFMAQARQAAERELAAALPSDLAGGRDVVRVVAEGSPLSQILEYATTNNIDLIVMGTQGRTGLSQFLVGSVAERVVRHASCPVLTVRPPQHRAAAP